MHCREVTERSPENIQLDFLRSYCRKTRAPHHCCGLASCQLQEVCPRDAVLICIYSKLHLISGSPFPSYDVGRWVSKDTGRWVHYGKDWRVIIITLRSAFAVGDRGHTFATERCCDYTGDCRQQSPSIRGVRKGSFLFQWQRKVLSEWAAASSRGIKNREEWLTSSVASV